jgi:Cu+-exporting ATPase
MAIMVGAGRGARSGVLIKNAEALEALEKVDVLLIDKTGTLTIGKPELVSVQPIGDIPIERSLAVAAGLETGSEHPLASAVLAAAKQRGVLPAPTSDFLAVAGKGVRGAQSGISVAIGNRALMAELGIETGTSETIARKMSSDGQTVAYVASGGSVISLLGIADPIKDGAAGAIDALKRSGVRIVMVTGDRRETAEAVADKLGLGEFEAEVLPTRKREIVVALQQQGHRVAMAGDGINDAPALSQADVGIAMGTGTGVAIESAAITLVGGRLEGVARARRLSRATMGTIRQNLFFAFMYNLIGVPVAAGVLYPLTGTLLSPMLSALAMSFSSVSVIGNSLRLVGARLD